MNELSLELFLDNGEYFDNTVTLPNDSLIDIEYQILNFMEDYFNEGFRECDPQYYKLDNGDYENLKLGMRVTIKINHQFSAFNSKKINPVKCFHIR